MRTKTLKDIGQRIASIRGSLSRPKFSSKTGVHKNTLERYEAGDRAPDAEFLYSVSELGINTHWLITGEGSMMIEDLEKPNVEPRRGDALTDKDMDKRKGLIDMLAEATNNPDQVWAALLMELITDYDLGDNANKRIMQTLKTLTEMK